MIALYFGILLCVAWWVVRKGKDSAADYFLAGRNLGWWIIGASIFASNIGSEHIVGLAGSGATSGVAMAHYELHAWCLLVLAWVFVPFYMRSMVFTMPEFLERRFNENSRYVLSIVSLITFVISKIAVGIFAGGVVFGTLFPEMRLNLGGVTIDSFWIGSVLVIVLTGLYTTLGGMRAVAYNDAVQVTVLIVGSALLTGYGLIRLGRLERTAPLVRLRHVQSLEAADPRRSQGTWAPVLETNAAGADGQAGVVFQRQFPWLGMLFCAPIIGLWYWCTDQYIVQRALGAPNEAMARRGSIFAAFLKLFPVYLFIIPGLICYALAKSGKVPELASMIGPDGQAIPAPSQRRFPHDGAISAAAGHSRHRGGRIALRADGIAGRRVQRLLHALHRRSVSEVEKGRVPASTGAHRPHRHRHHGGDRAGLDSRHQERAGPVQLSASRAGLSGAAHLRGLLLRRFLQAPERPGGPLGDDRRASCWAFSAWWSIRR